MEPLTSKHFPNMIYMNFTLELGLPWWLSGKESVQEMQGRYLDQKDPLEKEMATHSNMFAWEIYGQKSLAGYSPWGHKESDTT